MKKTILFLYLIVISILHFSCKEPVTNLPTAQVPDAPMEVPAGFSDKGIDRSTTEMLINQGDHIDYIFNTIPLSMNQDGQKAVLQEMSYVSNKPMPGIPQNCLPLARKIYLGKGEIIMEADIYFSDGCLFQIYIKDEKPLYGNLLSKEGITFYKNLMLQARQSMPEEMRNRYTIPSGI